MKIRKVINSKSPEPNFLKFCDIVRKCKCQLFMWSLLYSYFTLRCFTISGSYFCYYSRHAIVVTTVVTTVATENRMTTHVIFFSSTDARCQALFLRKNCVLQSDNDDDAKVFAALPSAKERQAKNDDECAFSCICHHRRNSRNLSGMWSSLALLEPFETMCLSGCRSAVMKILGK